MNLNGHETDGVPAPSEFELGTWVSDDDGPPYAELMRLYEAARTLILDWQQRNEQLWKLYRGSVDVTNVYAAQEGIYRAEITDLRTEVARLRGALEPYSCKENWWDAGIFGGFIWSDSTHTNDPWAIADAALAPPSCAGDYGEACDKCVGA